ncbi:MAG: imidazole glycerol phosphate synthase subunit HisH [Acidiferrobacterales bacterium]|nr:imidazole glycerol phosphate synthase subunit HisH [Acidiferrobacterales bacterium]
MQIAIIDLGIGNLRSVEQAMATVAPDANVIVTSESQVLVDAERVVLPGQGAIGTWFEALRERGLESTINQVIQEKPLLGICVGMQALFDYCEEDGGVKGLGLFDGSVRHFSHFHKGADLAKQRLKIPQMGWNQVSQKQSHPLWHSIDDAAHFYFVHSYCANVCADAGQEMVYGVADYQHQFIAAAGLKNVFAVQFHPEKSHRDGLQLLRNFAQWNGAV